MFLVCKQQPGSQQAGNVVTAEWNWSTQQQDRHARLPDGLTYTGGWRRLDVSLWQILLIWICGDTGPNLAGPRQVTASRGCPDQRKSQKKRKNCYVLDKHCLILLLFFFLKRRAYLAPKKLIVTGFYWCACVVQCEKPAL